MPSQSQISDKGSIRHNVPILSVSLETENGSTELKRQNGDISMEFRYKMTYHGVNNINFTTAGPLTFFIDVFRDELNYQLDRRVQGGSEQWIPCRYGDYCPGFVNDQPSKIHVAQSEDFVCLHPSESWEGSFTLDDELWEFPDHLGTGAIFRFAFKGATIGWWDWGTKDGTHADTIVTFRGYGQSTRSDFTDDDNGGRPQIFVPSSNEIELVLAD
ncbi:hypothetical protein DTO012A7_3375 [Penicillium roqueforti]|nr:hypothetical protein CBS147332_7063 [Penicillium roqueforti]KAI2715887.1 hypothetical protein CBS147318_5738 [Penicillium roqueforti]KAI3118288.1 hypothetical protein CBS147331_3227 [Penicillium roqueforti]KAI3237691.1 hypothetical protein DTO012A7_3375 [Penicillium roqueforti]